MTVRTRFAPSPTGYLHIGGVRTALFNWLFARKHGGQFILRIDDTDQQRNVEAALAPILHGFRWLGLDWDEGAEVGGKDSGPYGPYYQSRKLERYQAAVKQLVESGHAYWDYATPEETKAESEAAEKEKRPKIYSRRWMAATTADRARFEAQGRKGAVKLKMPREGACEFQDHVRGSVRVEWATEQDIVIQRSDGTVTYNLANVVDDFDMKISHVIRAEEHLSNTPRQIFMLEGLGYPRPEYAHVPFVAEPGSKNKLSKRKIAQYLKNSDFKKVYEHGKAIADRLGIVATPESFNPVLVEFYEQVGYLPDAIINYLLLLGWAHEDGKSEFFTRQEMLDLFTLERVNKGSASLDVKKLWAFQDRYWQLLSVEEKVERSLPFLQRAGLVPATALPAATDVRIQALAAKGRAQSSNAEEDQEAQILAQFTSLLGEVESRMTDLVTQIVTEAGPRMIVAGDILNYEEFFLADDALKYDDKALDKHVRKSPDSLRKLREVVANAEPFVKETLRQRIEEFANSAGVKPGALSQALPRAQTNFWSCPMAATPLA